MAGTDGQSVERELDSEGSRVIKVHVRHVVVRDADAKRVEHREDDHGHQPC